MRNHLKTIIPIVFSLLLFQGCVMKPAGNQTGNFVLTGDVPAGLNIKNLKWEVKFEDVDQMGPANLPVKPPKARTSWINLRGSIINEGSKAIQGLHLKVSVCGKSKNRIYPVEFTIDRVLGPSETLPLIDYQSQYLDLGEITVLRCELKTEIVESNKGQAKTTN